MNNSRLYDADETVTAMLNLPGKVPVTGSWSFVTPEPFTKDIIEVTGDKGVLRFSVFSFKPIRLILDDKEEEFNIKQPEHIQMPLIQSIVDELNGKGTCPSTGLSGAITSQVMDRITG